jgi:hypothetical protein
MTCMKIYDNFYCCKCQCEFYKNCELKKVLCPDCGSTLIEFYK